MLLLSSRLHLCLLLSYFWCRINNSFAGVTWIFLNCLLGQFLIWERCSILIGLHVKFIRRKILLIRGVDIRIAAPLQIEGQVLIQQKLYTLGRKATLLNWFVGEWRHDDRIATLFLGAEYRRLGQSVFARLDLRQVFTLRYFILFPLIVLVRLFNQRFEIFVQVQLRYFLPKDVSAFILLVLLSFESWRLRVRHLGDRFDTVRLLGAKRFGFFKNMPLLLK